VALNYSTYIWQHDFVTMHYHTKAAHARAFVQSAKASLLGAIVGIRSESARFPHLLGSWHVANMQQANHQCSCAKSAAAAVQHK
jgi:hypothetical protein